MPVPTLISQLSTTASLNSPDGAVDVPSSIDDYQRAHASFIAQLRDEKASISGIQAQTYTAFTTGGTGTAFTLTPTPAITAYAASQSFFVTFNNDSGANPTLAISGLATPPNLVRRLTSGALRNIAAGEIKSGATCQVVGLSATQYEVKDLPYSIPGLSKFTANGTFVVPPGINTIYVSGCAGGSGGGGGGGSVGSTGDGGSGGGAGGSAGQSIFKTSYAVTPGESHTVTIGAGGAGGAGGANTGTNGASSTAGGNSVLGTLVTLTGGASSGGGDGNTSTSRALGTGGGYPGAGFPKGSMGSDGAFAGNGGAGASSIYGGGGGSGRAANGAAGVAGYPAGGFGAGGGGGGGVYGKSAYAGGAGASGTAGFLVIEW